MIEAFIESYISSDAWDSSISYWGITPRNSFAQRLKTLGFPQEGVELEAVLDTDSSSLTITAYKEDADNLEEVFQHTFKVILTLAD